MSSLSHPVSLIGKSLHKLAGLPVPALLAIAIGWIVLEFVWLGKFSLMIVGDNISIIPYYMAMVAGDMTVDNWMPYPAAGTDFSATGYSAIILRWVFSILPSWAAVQVLAIAPVVAGVLGVYGLCRRNFNLDIAASIFAGFSYGVLFFREIFFLSAVPGYLPLTVLALSHLLDNKSDVRWWLGLAGAGFLIAETSFITRLVPWPVITYAVWFLIVERRRRFSDTENRRPGSGGRAGGGGGSRCLWFVPAQF